MAFKPETPPGARKRNAELTSLHIFFGEHADEIVAIKTAAAKSGMNVSVFIRQCVAYAMDAMEETDK